MKDITQPTFIIDRIKLERNILRMAKKASDNGLIFRPHFKTHQLFQIGHIFKDFGINKITVSSVKMAKQFVLDGWNDITIAFPVNFNEIDEINSLNSKITLNLLIDSIEAFQFLEKNLRSEANVFIKIDCGYHRAGIHYNALDILDTLVELFNISDKLKLLGFLSHSGNTYQANKRSEIVDIHFFVKSKLIELINRYSNKLIVSVGDTPSCSIVEDFDGIDEIRPGNFVFYDWMQYKLGSCDFEDIAAAVACPVVSCGTGKSQAVIYGGAVHFSKEYVQEGSNKNHGQLVSFDKDYTWHKPYNSIYLKSLSQEHGIINIPNTHNIKFKIGEIVLAIPIHSCLTRNLFQNEMIYFIN